MKTTNLFLNKTDGIFSTEITTRQTTIQTTKIIENTGIFNNLEKFLDNSYYCCCEYGMKTTNLFLNKLMVYFQQKLLLDKLLYKLLKSLKILEYLII